MTRRRLAWRPCKRHNYQCQLPVHSHLIGSADQPPRCTLDPAPWTFVLHPDPSATVDPAPSCMDPPFQDRAPQEHVDLASAHPLRVPGRLCAGRSVAIPGDHAPCVGAEPACAGIPVASCLAANLFKSCQPSLCNSFSQSFFVNQRGTQFSPSGLSIYYSKM